MVSVKKWAWAVVFVGVRLGLALTFPIFNDESIYTLWARFISAGLAEGLKPVLADGKQPGLMIFWSWFVGIGNDPLVSLRLTSIGFGVVTAWLVFRLYRMIARKEMLWWLKVVYVLIPGQVFFEGLRRTRFTSKDILNVVITETISVINLLILYTGLKYLTSLQSSLIVNTRPVFMTIAGILFLSEREESHEWAGLILSVLGTILFIMSPLISGNMNDLVGFSLIGFMLVLSTNVIDTMGMLRVKKFYPKLNKPAISGLHMWIGITLFTALLGFDNQLPSLSLLQIPSVLIAVLYMGLFGSVVALTLSNFGYTKIEASEATLFYYLHPLVYVPLSVFWLREKISPLQVIAMLLILFGVWWAERRPHRKRSILKHGIPLLPRLRLHGQSYPLTPQE